MSVYRRAGHLIVGSRLKRLSERILNEISKLYQELELAFEPSWFPLFYLLRDSSQLTMSELAAELEISPPGASQMVQSLVRRGLIEIHSSKQDRRIRRLSLSQKGHQLLEQVEPLWSVLDEALAGLGGEDLMPHLDHFEERLNRSSLHQDLIHRFQMTRTRSDLQYGFLEKPHHDFRNLIITWLQEHPGHALPDARLLNAPLDYLEKQGLRAVVVTKGDRIAGTLIFSQKPHTPLRILLTCIAPEFRDQGMEAGMLNYLHQSLKSLDLIQFPESSGPNRANWLEAWQELSEKASLKNN